MTDNISKLLTQSPAAKWFFITVGSILTAIASWGFILSILHGTDLSGAIQGVPSQLVTMWCTACGAIAAGADKTIEAIEKKLNKDLDGDGNIGVDNSSSVVPTNVVDTSAINTNNNITQIPVVTQSTTIENTVQNLNNSELKVLTGADCANI